MTSWRVAAAAGPGWRVRAGQPGDRLRPLVAADWRAGAAQPGVVVVRASGGTAVFAGQLVEYAADTQRIASEGLLIEPGRINHVRNARGEGAATGVVGSGGALPTYWSVFQSGGLDTEVVALLNGSGFSGVRLRASGTATGGQYSIDFETTTGIVAAPSQAWSVRLFHRLHAAPAPPTGYLGRITGRTSAGAAVTGNIFTPAMAAPTATLAPVSFGATLTGDGSIARMTPGWRANLAAGQAHDFTVDICFPQAEQAEDSTTAILPPPGSLQAGTRAAETATMAVPGPDRGVRLLVQDLSGAEWRTVAVAAGTIPLAPRAGQRAIRRARVWEVATLTADEEAALGVPA